MVPCVTLCSEPSSTPYRSNHHPWAVGVLQGHSVQPRAGEHSVPR